MPWVASEGSERGVDRRALLRIQRRAQQHAAERQPQAERQSRHEHCQQQSAVKFHDSRSRTFCTRSRVENGLVT